MPVPADSPHIVDHDGREVAFCSLRCLVRWRSEHRGLTPADAIADTRYADGFVTP
jgi:hypothetical protein